MTQNQIAFATLKETQRHNVATEMLGNLTLDESVRHNVVTETESIRHNYAQEGLQHETNMVNDAHYVRMDVENARHNQVTEAQGWNQLELGWAGLGENVRHNVASEGIGRSQANAALTQAAAASSQAATAQYRAQNDYYLGLANQRVNEQRADAYAENLGYQNAYTAAQTETESTRRETLEKQGTYYNASALNQYQSGQLAGKRNEYYWWEQGSQTLHNIGPYMVPLIP